MGVAAPCHSPAELWLGRIVASLGMIAVMVSAYRPVATCPGCGQAGRRIHGHYTLRLVGLP